MKRVLRGKSAWLLHVQTKWKFLESGSGAVLSFSLTMSPDWSQTDWLTLFSLVAMSTMNALLQSFNRVARLTVLRNWENCYKDAVVTEINPVQEVHLCRRKHGCLELAMDGIVLLSLQPYESHLATLSLGSCSNDRSWTPPRCLQPGSSLSRLWICLPIWSAAACSGPDVVLVRRPINIQGRVWERKKKDLTWGTCLNKSTARPTLPLLLLTRFSEQSV